MNFKTFITGIMGSFGVAWLFMVVLPFAKTQELIRPMFDPEKDGKDGEFQVSRVGKIQEGASVYAANGCYTCHSQLVRPTYAGNDVWATSWAGKGAETARETSPYDYDGEKIAQIGLSRTGPDLSNVGYRVESYVEGTEQTAEKWLYEHLYDPRGNNPSVATWSNCPSSKYLFKIREVKGSKSEEALKVDQVNSCCWKGKNVEVIPTAEARALVSYLLSMKKDEQLPYSLNPNPKKKPAN